MLEENDPNNRKTAMTIYEKGQQDKYDDDSDSDNIESSGNQSFNEEHISSRSVDRQEIIIDYEELD